MNSVIIVSIVFGSLVTLAGLLCGTVLVIIRMRQTNPRRSKKNSHDETMVVQELYRGLEKMEKRIEALETILMDGPYTGDKQ